MIRYWPLGCGTLNTLEGRLSGIQALETGTPPIASLSPHLQQEGFFWVVEARKNVITKNADKNVTNTQLPTLTINKT